MRHPRIVTFIGSCVSNEDIHFVTEYMENGSLKGVLENRKINLSFLQQLKMCHDISLALYYLHSRKPEVFHRDLKSSNCLVDENLRIKLCDFGISKIYEQSHQLSTNSSSTCFWMAPEFLIDGIFTNKSDIYSLAILFWEIFARDTVPYKNLNEVNFLIGEPEILKKRPLMPKNINIEIKELIESCWDVNPEKRPNIKEIVNKIEYLTAKLKSNKSEQ